MIITMTIKTTIIMTTKTIMITITIIIMVEAQTTIMEVQVSQVDLKSLILRHQKLLHLQKEMIIILLLFCRQCLVEWLF